MKKESEKTQNKSMKKYKEIVFIKGIPRNIRISLENGEFDKIDLDKISFTDQLRYACLDRNFEDFLWEKRKLRGVYMNIDYNLYPYQQSTIEWMKEKENVKNELGVRGGILSLVQGLGKTITTLIHILSSERGEYPSLVVASKTVAGEWREQIKRFFPQMYRPKVLFYHKDMISDTEYQNMDRENVKDYDVVVTTYDVCRNVFSKNKFYLREIEELGADNTLQKGKVIAIHERTKRSVLIKNKRGPEFLYNTPWQRVIADESQCFANPKTILYKSMMGLYGEYKWCLTGTPIRNKDLDIWAQFRFLGYTQVSRATEWSKTGRKIYITSGLQNYILRMTYEEAGIVLPIKHEHELVLKLEHKEKLAYDYILKITKDVFSKCMNKLVSFSCVLAVFTRLRQTCLGPYIITQGGKRSKKTTNAAELQALESIDQTIDSLGAWIHKKDGTAGTKSSKVKLILNILKKIPKGEKVIVFSFFSSFLDLLYTAIEEDDDLCNFGICQLDGSVTGNDRINTINNFRKHNEIRCFLISYKTGSEGLNLAEANHVILVEPWWSPAVKKQGESRVYRNGQKRECVIYNLIVEGTIENNIQGICYEKEKISENYLEGAHHKIKKGTGLDMRTLQRILK